MMCDCSLKHQYSLPNSKYWSYLNLSFSYGLNINQLIAQILQYSHQLAVKHKVAYNLQHHLIGDIFIK